MGAQGGNSIKAIQPITGRVRIQLMSDWSQAPNHYIPVNYNKLLAGILTSFHPFQFIPNNTTSHVSPLLSNLSGWATHYLLDVFCIFHSLWIWGCYFLHPPHPPQLCILKSYSIIKTLLRFCCVLEGFLGTQPWISIMLYLHNFINLSLLFSLWASSSLRTETHFIHLCGIQVAEPWLGLNTNWLNGNAVQRKWKLL